jgi:hypothetical protein
MHTLGLLGGEGRDATIDELSPGVLQDPKRRQHERCHPTKCEHPNPQPAFRHQGKRHPGKKHNQTVTPEATDKHQLSAAVKTACLATVLHRLHVPQRQINCIASFILDVDHKSHQHSNQTLTRSSRIGPSFG